MIFVGDVHGKYYALLQLIKNTKYDFQQDRLIFVGDYIDGFLSPYFDVKKTIDMLIGYQKENPYRTEFLLGNHDQWMLEWINAQDTVPKNIWTSQGGEFTLKSYDCPYMLPYKLVNNKIPQDHIDFLNGLVPSYIDDNFVAVHGGFANKDTMEITMAGNLTTDMLWDRTFYRTSVKSLLDVYKKIFGERIFICGHTPYGPMLTETHKVKRFLIDSGKTIEEWHGKVFAVVFDRDLQHKFVGAEQPES